MTNRVSSQSAIIQGTNAPENNAPLITATTTNGISGAGSALSSAVPVNNANTGICSRIHSLICKVMKAIRNCLEKILPGNFFPKATPSTNTSPQTNNSAASPSAPMSGATRSEQPVILSDPSDVRTSENEEEVESPLNSTEDTTEPPAATIINQSVANSPWSLRSPLFVPHLRFDSPSEEEIENLQSSTVLEAVGPSATATTNQQTTVSSARPAISPLFTTPLQFTTLTLPTADENEEEIENPQGSLTALTTPESSATVTTNQQTVASSIQTLPLSSITPIPSIMNSVVVSENEKAIFNRIKGELNSSQEPNFDNDDFRTAIAVAVKMYLKDWASVTSARDFFRVLIRNGKAEDILQIKRPLLRLCVTTGICLHESLFDLCEQIAARFRNNSELFEIPLDAAKAGVLSTDDETRDRAFKLFKELLSLAPNTSIVPLIQAILQESTQSRPCEAFYQILWTLVNHNLFGFSEESKQVIVARWQTDAPDLIQALGNLASCDDSFKAGAAPTLKKDLEKRLREAKAALTTHVPTMPRVLESAPSAVPPPIVPRFASQALLNFSRTALPTSSLAISSTVVGGSQSTPSTKSDEEILSDLTESLEQQSQPNLNPVDLQKAITYAQSTFVSAQVISHRKAYEFFELLIKNGKEEDVLMAKEALLALCPSAYHEVFQLCNLILLTRAQPSEELVSILLDAVSKVGVRSLDQQVRRAAFTFYKGLLQYAPQYCIKQLIKDILTESQKKDASFYAVVGRLEELVNQDFKLIAQNDAEEERRVEEAKIVIQNLGNEDLILLREALDNLSNPAKCTNDLIRKNFSLLKEAFDQKWPAIAQLKASTAPLESPNASLSSETDEND